MAEIAAQDGITMSERAARRIHEIMTEERNAGMMLRVAVGGGGCSGFQYSFSLDQTRNPDDLTLERDGARLLIDEMSIALLQGSAIDWHEDVAGAMFVIANPNATASCGCGTSFSIG